LKLGSGIRHHASHNASHNCASHSNSHVNSHMNSATSSSSSATAQSSANNIFTTTTNTPNFGTGMDTSTSYGMGGFFNYAPPVEEVSFQKPTSYQPGKFFY